MLNERVRINDERIWSVDHCLFASYGTIEEYYFVR